MKTDACVSGMRKSGNPYTKYEGGGRRPAPSYDDSIRATGLPDAAAMRSGNRPARVVHKIEFRILPPLGTVLMHDGQRYIVVGSDLHTRRDGRTVPIICWESHCAQCSVPFRCWSGLRSGTLNRRCSDHHAPGKAVAASARKRAVKHISRNGKRRKP